MTVSLFTEQSQYKAFQSTTLYLAQSNFNIHFQHTLHIAYTIIYTLHNLFQEESILHCIYNKRTF